MPMRFAKPIAAFFLALLVPQALLAQGLNPDPNRLMCAKDYLWNISTEFDKRLLESQSRPCLGNWDCFGNESGRPDIQICINGQCTNIDEARITTEKCRDSFTCTILRKRIGEQAVTIVVKDDDAFRDDELVAIVFGLKRPASVKPDDLKLTYSTRYENKDIDYKAFFNGDYGKALVLMEPSLGWTECPTYSDLARVIKGVDITKLIEDTTCSAALYNRELGSAQSALSRGLLPSGTAVGSVLISVVNMGLFQLEAEAYTEVFANPPATWSNTTWANVIDSVDALPLGEKYDNRAVGGMVQTLKNCMKP